MVGDGGEGLAGSLEVCLKPPRKSKGGHHGDAPLGNLETFGELRAFEKQQDQGHTTGFRRTWNTVHEKQQQKKDCRDISNRGSKPIKATAAMAFLSGLKPSGLPL